MIKLKIQLFEQLAQNSISIIIQMAKDRKPNKFLMKEMKDK